MQEGLVEYLDEQESLVVLHMEYIRGDYGFIISIALKGEDSARVTEEIGLECRRSLNGVEDCGQFGLRLIVLRI